MTPVMSVGRLDVGYITKPKPKIVVMERGRIVLTLWPGEAFQMASAFDETIERIERNQRRAAG
jgi:hypothetical protein